MKHLFLMVIMCLFLTGCVMSSAQKGAGIGGLAGMAGSALGKGDRRTTAIYGAAGALLGYIIGNEMDKNDSSQNREQSYMVPVGGGSQAFRNPNVDNRYNNQYNSGYNNQYNNQHNSQYSSGPRTDCRKIITRKTVNGQIVETVEEVCNSTKSEYGY